MKKTKRKTKYLALLMAACMLFTSGCGKLEAVNGAAGPLLIGFKKTEKKEKREGPSPAAVRYVNEASGVMVERNDKAVIDLSNVSKGYVMICYEAQSEKRLKVQMQGPGEKYSYDIYAGSWSAFPLSDGNGDYKISVYENVEGKKYAQVISASVNVSLENEFYPFLYPNSYVNYSDEPQTLAVAQEITAGISDTIEIVDAVYNYVVSTLSYDKNLAQTVKAGYVPDLDTVLERKEGICFDYAALMAGMLRLSDVPCKLVVGYVGGACHAWISVWVEGEGWVDNVIHFDGSEWHRMDPTYASTANRKDVSQYVGDGTNYQEKFYY